MLLQYIQTDFFKDSEQLRRKTVSFFGGGGGTDPSVFGFGMFQEKSWDGQAPIFGVFFNKASIWLKRPGGKILEQRWQLY